MAGCTVAQELVAFNASHQGRQAVQRPGPDSDGLHHGHRGVPDAVADQALLGAGRGIGIDQADVDARCAHRATVQTKGDSTDEASDPAQGSDR